MKIDPKVITNWWPVGVLVVGVIALWGSLPQRVAKAEEQIDDLKAWTKEMQGYTRAVEEQRQQYPMEPPAPEAQWLYDKDKQGRCWECWGFGYQDCDVNQRWERCQE